MHPVLRNALTPLADEIRPLSLEEAQLTPPQVQGRWSAQQIIEHLILSYELTEKAVTRHLSSGRLPKAGRSLLESVLRLQSVGLGFMPKGVPAIGALRPTSYSAESGAAIAERFLQAAERMDLILVAARRKFGIQACGLHPMYGTMRVDEWRRYHAVHARHHAPQLRNAVELARGAAKAS